MLQGQTKKQEELKAHVIMDMLTWTETFYANLTRVNDNTTRMVMGRIGLGQPLDWGIARKFIGSLFYNMESTLRSTSQNPSS